MHSAFPSLRAVPFRLHLCVVTRWSPVSVPDSYAVSSWLLSIRNSSYWEILSSNNSFASLTYLPKFTRSNSAEHPVIVVEAFEQMMDDLASHELSAIGAGSKGLLVDTAAFTARLKTIKSHVNLENEAGSRMIVDHILLDLSDIGDAINIHLQFYAELRLTRTDHPVKVDYLGSITFLTGIADYGLTALPLQKL
ncbi:hypothetical protein AB1N83_012147, partial [Pleurotus pulmonarius]